LRQVASNVEEVVVTAEYERMQQPTKEKKTLTLYRPNSNDSAEKQWLHNAKAQKTATII
jgi:hypothetical protein